MEIKEIIGVVALLLMLVCLGGMWITIAFRMERNGNDLTRRESKMAKRLACAKAGEVGHE